MRKDTQGRREEENEQKQEWKIKSEKRNAKMKRRRRIDGEGGRKNTRADRCKSAEITESNRGQYEL